MESRTLAAPTGYTSIGEIARAYGDGRLDDNEFVGAACSLPPVKQAPQPDGEWWDDWAREHGPVSDLVSVFKHGLIPARLYEMTLDAMAKAGHEA